uniref:lipid IV(A) 3-deoxy-D-manno-octulosonic acid transferase n=1 Tax=Vibrio gallicus TaxID=190897 RepID=UPI0021C499EC|nr:lipid IV(A) 3-deoxy-D-manno-octulosonic acid transferase [Vibrio gallicus]
MIRILYSLLLLLLSPVLLFTLLRTKQGKPAVGARWSEYFGITPRLNEQKPIWIHTVSVGETIAATPFIKALKQAHPDQPILITTTTTTGAEQAEKLGSLVTHRYMPIDFSWCVRLFLRSIQPRCLIIMETELWPNTLHCVANTNIPIIVLNARLSERSYARYNKVLPIFKSISQNISHFICQHQDDAIRFIQLGVAKDRVSISGSLKFDIDIAPDITKRAVSLRESLGKHRPVWIAASTHAGEDEQLLDAHRLLLEHIPDALMIIVPRHPERFEQVMSLSQQSGFNTVSRTSQLKITSDTQVYLADTMGEMLLLIGSADICFMAGSLIGDKVGGHNPLEPAALSKPILNGSSYFNFSDITHQLQGNDAVTICDSSQQIAIQLRHLISNPNQSTQMGLRALEVVKHNQGAVQKSVQAVSEFID